MVTVRFRDWFNIHYLSSIAANRPTLFQSVFFQCDFERHPVFFRGDARALWRWCLPVSSTDFIKTYILLSCFLSFRLVVVGRIFISYCMFFNLCCEVASSFTKVMGVTSRSSKLINNKGLQIVRNGIFETKVILYLYEEKTNFKSWQKKHSRNCLKILKSLSTLIPPLTVKYSMLQTV